MGIFLCESMQSTTTKHYTYCFWIPILMYNLVPAQEYNINMSGLWFGTICMVIIAYWLVQGWAGPVRFTVMTGHVPPTVYFKLLWLSHPALYLINFQSWSLYLHCDEVFTNMSALFNLTSIASIPSKPECFFPSFLSVISYLHFPWRSIQVQFIRPLKIYLSPGIWVYNSYQLFHGWGGGCNTWFNLYRYKRHTRGIH